MQSKGTSHKWLDLQKYFNLLRQDDELQRIWYFTAKVKGAQLARQEAYFDALSASPLLELVFGLYKEKTTSCRVVGCGYEGKKTYRVSEEKRTDVNIALQMIDNAYQGACERMILVSGDSDLVPAVQLIKKRHPRIQVIVYVPASNPKRGAAKELRSAAGKNKTLPMALLSKAQFPTSLRGFSGNIVKKTSSW